MRNEKSKIKNSIIIPILTITLIGTFLTLPKSASAFWPFDALGGNTHTEDNGEFAFPPLIQKIIEKFNLNPDEVKTVMDEARSERHEQMDSQLEKRLNEAMENGKLTEQQKDKILEKHEQMEENKENWQNLSWEEKREKMKGFHDEMRDWANEEGINLQDVMRFGMKMGRRGFGMGFK